MNTKWYDSPPWQKHNFSNPHEWSNYWDRQLWSTSKNHWRRNTVPWWSSSLLCSYRHFFTGSWLTDAQPTYVQHNPVGVTFGAFYQVAWGYSREWPPCASESFPIQCCSNSIHSVQDNFSPLGSANNFWNTSDWRIWRHVGRDHRSQGSQVLQKTKPLACIKIKSCMEGHERGNPMFAWNGLTNYQVGWTKPWTHRVVNFSKKNKHFAGLERGKRDFFPLFWGKTWRKISSKKSMKITSQALVYADIAVKSYNRFLLANQWRWNLTKLPESVVVGELRKVCPPERTLKFICLIDVKNINFT